MSTKNSSLAFALIFNFFFPLANNKLIHARTSLEHPLVATVTFILNRKSFYEKCFITSEAAEASIELRGNGRDERSPKRERQKRAWEPDRQVLFATSSIRVRRTSSSIQTLNFTPTRPPVRMCKTSSSRTARNEQKTERRERQEELFSGLLKGRSNTRELSHTTHP